MHFGSIVWTPNPMEGCLTLPSIIGYRVQQGLYTILGKTSYTLTKHAFAILYTILGKNT